MIVIVTLLSCIESSGQNVESSTGQKTLVRCREHRGTVSGALGPGVGSYNGHHRNCRVVPGLAKGQFSVFEDQVPQVISYFTSENAPATIGVVFDASGSMKPNLCSP